MRRHDHDAAIVFSEEQVVFLQSFLEALLVGRWLEYLLIVWRGFQEFHIRQLRDKENSAPLENTEQCHEKNSCHAVTQTLFVRHVRLYPGFSNISFYAGFSNELARYWK